MIRRLRDLALPGGAAHGRGRLHIIAAGPGPMPEALRRAGWIGREPAREHSQAPGMERLEQRDHRRAGGAASREKDT